MPLCGNWIWLIAEVTSLRLMPGMPTCAARLVPKSTGVIRNSIELQPKRNSFSQLEPSVCVSLNARPCALMLPFARAEREPRVAVRQRRRQQAVRLLIAVAREEAVRLRQVVVDLHVHLIVLTLDRRVDQIVVDLLSVRPARAGHVRRRIQLLQDVLRRRIPPRLRNGVVGERLVGVRIVDDPVQLAEVALAHPVRGHRGRIRLPRLETHP